MASLIWTSVFFFLIAELFVTLVLVIPVPRKIRNYLARKVISPLKLGERLSKPILFVGIGLVFAFLESYFAHGRIVARMVEEYGGTSWVHRGDPHTAHDHMHDKERKYKAERNMYLAGFSFTLLFVIGRLTQLMQESVELEAECERITSSNAGQAVDSAVADSGSKKKEKKGKDTSTNIEMKTIRKSGDDKKKD